MPGIGRLWSVQQIMYHFTTLMLLRPIFFCCWQDVGCLPGARGQPPVCFAADYLVFDHIHSVPCIQDYEVQQFIEQVTNSSAYNLTVGNCPYRAPISLCPDKCFKNVKVYLQTTKGQGMRLAYKYS